MAVIASSSTLGGRTILEVLYGANFLQSRYMGSHQSLQLCQLGGVFAHVAAGGCPRAMRSLYVTNVSPTHTLHRANVAETS